MDKILLLSVLGLLATAAATELGLEGLKPSELKEIEKEIAAGNVPPNYVAEKPKRGVAKLSNTDSPSFNHLSSVAKPTFSVNPQTSYSVQPSYSQPQAAYNPAAPAYSSQVPYTSPVRLVYGNQYYPANQYLSYLQNPQIASQVAAQYQYQPVVPHFVQTPTQIQYVSPPNYQQVPSAQFKALSSKVAPASTTSDAQNNQATSQVVLPSNMASTPVYQQQPQYVMYLIPAQHQGLLGQQQSLLYPGHQMLLVGAQNPLLNLYSNSHRFSLPYNSPAATQLAYLNAATQQQQQQQQVQYQTLESTAQQSSADNTQKQTETAASSSNTFGVRTKA